MLSFIQMNTKSKVKSCICHHYRQTIRMIEEETWVLRVVVSDVLLRELVFQLYLKSERERHTLL